MNIFIVWLIDRIIKCTRALAGDQTFLLLLCWRIALGHWSQRISATKWHLLHFSAETHFQKSFSFLPCTTSSFPCSLRLLPANLSHHHHNSLFLCGITSCDSRWSVWDILVPIWHVPLTSFLLSLLDNLRWWCKAEIWIILSLFIPSFSPHPYSSCSGIAVLWQWPQPLPPQLCAGHLPSHCHKSGVTPEGLPFAACGRSGRCITFCKAEA